MRKIVIPQEAMFVLKQYRKWQFEERIHLGDSWQRKEKKVHGTDYDNDRLFTKWDGSPIFPDTPSHWFKKFREKYGLPPLTFHQLRHTNASLMISQGIDVATVGNRLGHTTPATTMKIYAHALQRPDQDCKGRTREQPTNWMRCSKRRNQQQSRLNRLLLFYILFYIFSNR